MYIYEIPQGKKITNDINKSVFILIISPQHHTVDLGSSIVFIIMHFTNFPPTSMPLLSSLQACLSRPLIVIPLQPIVLERSPLFCKVRPHPSTFSSSNTMHSPSWSFCTCHFLSVPTLQLIFQTSDQILVSQNPYSDQMYLRVLARKENLMG